MMAPKRKLPEGETEEEKQLIEKRREQNREAARRCRDKKKEKGEAVKKKVQQLRSEHTNLNYQRMQLQREKDDLQKLLDNHAKICPNLKQILDSQCVTTPTCTNTTAEETLPRPLSRESNISMTCENDQRVPCHPYMGEDHLPQEDPMLAGVQTGRNPTGSINNNVQLLHSAVPPVHDSSFTRPTCNQREAEDTKPNLPNPIVIETHASSLGTETVNCFYTSIGRSETLLGSEPEQSSNITLANITSHEEARVNYLLSFSPGESSLNASHSPDRQQYRPVATSPISMCSDDNMNPPSPDAPLDQVPPSPRSDAMAQLHSEQWVNSLTTSGESSGKANIPLLVLREPREETEQSQNGAEVTDNISCLGDTMDLGLVILKGLTTDCE